MAHCLSERLDAHPHFSPWRDPQSGALSYLLSERVAPVQKNWYFVNDGMSADGQWLWFEVAMPPARQKSLAAVSLNPDHPEVRHFPATAVRDESPVLIDGGRTCLFVLDRTAEVWQQPLDGPVERLFDYPGEYISRRYVSRWSTHLTVSSDGRYLLVDGAVGNRWFVATIEMATGAFTVLKEFARHYNHSQFSPFEPRLFSIAQDHWCDLITGQYTHYDQRIWLMDLDGRYEPVHPQTSSMPGGGICHEWWAGDGTLCWIDYHRGAFYRDPASGSDVHVWRRPVCHAHCDPTLRYWVADQSPYEWPRPCEILFYDRQADHESHIVSGMPAPSVPRNHYHIDPHPRFTADGSGIVYTTTVAGQVDLAIAPVAELTAGA